MISLDEAKSICKSAGSNLACVQLVYGSAGIVCVYMKSVYLVYHTLSISSVTFTILGLGFLLGQQYLYRDTH